MRFWKSWQITRRNCTTEKLIKKTIEMYSSEINEFLYYAGYKYQVAIEEENTTDYHLVLKHIEELIMFKQ